jgi:uncharacterized protein YggT (Ycf19 family)
MTEREYRRETDTPANRAQEVYHRTDAAQADATLPEDAERDIYRERTSGPGGDHYVSSERVSVPSEASRRVATATRIKQVIAFLIGTVCVLLGMRFVLLLLGASEASGFVQFIYGLSRPFVLPFQGIFGEPVLNRSVVEWSSLVGIIVYLLVGYGLRRLVDVAYTPSGRSLA